MSDVLKRIVISTNYRVNRRAGRAAVSPSLRANLAQGPRLLPYRFHVAIGVLGFAVLVGAGFVAIEELGRILPHGTLWAPVANLLVRGLQTVWIVIWGFRFIEPAMARLKQLSFLSEWLIPADADPGDEFQDIWRSNQVTYNSNQQVAVSRLQNLALLLGDRFSRAYQESVRVSPAGRPAIESRAYIVSQLAEAAILHRWVSRDIDPNYRVPVALARLSFLDHYSHRAGLADEVLQKIRASDPEAASNTQVWGLYETIARAWFREAPSGERHL